MSKTQKKSTDSKKTVTRVICLVLAGAMFVSMVAAVLFSNL